MRWTQADLDAYRGRVTNASASSVPAPSVSQVSQPKRPKYRNRKVTDPEGRVHDSTKEYRRWCDLQLLEQAGRISDLCRQRVFNLIVNGSLVGRYKCDATYIENGERVVEDVKPTFKDDAARKKYHATLAYRHFKLKAALMKACHGIQVREV